MKTILIANPKGGAGKTTVSTNLAGYLASQGEDVYLWDLDRQKSSLHWLSLRPDYLPAIHRLDSEKGEKAAERTKGSKDSWLILDSPAGLHGEALSDIVKRSHKIIVPLVPSPYDMEATRTFLNDKVMKKGKSDLAIIGMRVDARTKAAERLDEFLAPIDLPVLTHLRETMNYVNAAFEGKSIFDLPPSLVEKDLEQWEPLLDWVEQ
jgi:chromosome partitioning protein